VAGDALVVSSPITLASAGVDAEARHEALVAQDVHGGLAHVEVEEGDLGVGGLLAERRRGPLADQLARAEVVGGERRVGRVDRVERRVERDDEDARVARCWTDDTMAEESDGTSRMPDTPLAMQVSMACTWLSWSPSSRPRSSTA
jgi:hypothetical protein